MTSVLTFLQIKTHRSAWMFLVGSVLMFLYGIYHFYFFDSVSDNFSKGFSGLWFLVTGAYVGLATWALFSKKGQAFLSEQEKLESHGPRTLWWLIRFLFACAAAAFATLMLISVLALPFLGLGSFETILFGKFSLWYELAIGLVYAPFVNRYLK